VREGAGRAGTPVVPVGPVEAAIGARS
jgi:hypothetical protein